MIHVVFFHGTLGWVIGIVSLWGGADLIGRLDEWLAGRAPR